MPSFYGQHLGNVNGFSFYDSEKKGTYSPATASEVGDHTSGTVTSGLTVTMRRPARSLCPDAPAVLQRRLGVDSFAAERWRAGAVSTAYMEVGEMLVGPWGRRLPVTHHVLAMPGGCVYVSASGPASVSCTITINGDVVAEETGEGDVVCEAVAPG